MKRGASGPEGCKSLYNMFCAMFPNHAELIRLYSPFDRHTIKLDGYDFQSFIFTFVDNKNWSFQTYKNYVEASKKIRA